MSAGNHGGLIAFLPNAKEVEHERAAGTYTFVAEPRHPEKSSEKRFKRACPKHIGRLATIDNAFLLGPNLEVLCAGYAIAPGKKKMPDVYEAVTLEGTQGARFPLLRHGSRHRAAANFADRFPGGLAILCSHDGDLRCLHRPVGQRHVLQWNISRPEG